MREKDICSNRHHANVNSFLANERIAGKKQSLRGKLYLSLLHEGPQTCEELSTRLGIRYTTVSARLAELKAERWIAMSGESRETSGGSRAAVVRYVSQEEREILLHPKRPGYSGRQGSLFT